MRAVELASKVYWTHDVCDALDLDLCFDSTGEYLPEGHVYYRVGGEPAISGCALQESVLFLEPLVDSHAEAMNRKLQPDIVLNVLLGLHWCK